MSCCTGRRMRGVFGNECVTMPDGSVNCSELIIGTKSPEQIKAEAAAALEELRRAAGLGPQPVYVPPPSSGGGGALAAVGLAAIAALAWAFS